MLNTSYSHTFSPVGIVDLVIHVYIYIEREINIIYIYMYKFFIHSPSHQSFVKFGE